LESQTTVSKQKALETLDYTFETIEDVPDDTQLLTQPLDDVLKIDSQRVYVKHNMESESLEVVNPKRSNLQADQQVRTSASHSIHKIDSIRKSISINQRYMFTSELFGNDADRFSETLEILDTKVNRSEALDFLDREIRPSYAWDEESEVVQEFLEILERRFI
jgi:hypothetical protein